MTEKLYLVCSSCGEAFDVMFYAKQHEESCKEEYDSERVEYELLPESEAM